MKKVLAFLLTIAMIIGLIPSIAMATEETSSSPYSGVYMVLTGKPTLVLEYTPEAGDSKDSFTTVFDVNGGTTVPAVEDDGCYVFKIAVSAARLYRPIVATLYNGETEVGRYEFVLADYAAKAKEIDPACSDLLNSLIAYSNYAAAYTGTEGTETIQAVEKITALADAYQAEITKEEISEIGASLVLNKACDLYFTFPAAIAGYTVKVNGSQVDLKENNGVLNKSTKPYYYVVEEILPQYWADDYVVEIYDGNTLKNQFSYSVLSYVRGGLSSSNAKLTNLLKAMYIYHRDAEMYCRTTARGAAENFANLDAWTLPTNAGTTQPTINDAGQLQFEVTSGVNGNYVSKAISSSDNKNNNAMAIDLDFRTTGTAEISVLVNGTYAIRLLIQNGQLRHVQKISGSNTTVVVAKNNTEGYPAFPLSTTEMHHARLVLDMVHQQYDLYIDGILWINGAGVCTNFASNNPLTLQMGVFNNGTGTVCFDNVQVSKLAPSYVDLTTTGLKKTVYAHTFDTLAGGNGYVFNPNNSTYITATGGKLTLSNQTAATLGTQKLSLLFVPGANGLTGKFAFEINAASSVLNASTTGIVINLGENATGVQNCANLTIYSTNIKYTDNTGEQTVNKKYFANGEEVRVKFIVDTDADTYDIYINDHLVVAGVNFRAKADRIDRIRLTTTMLGRYDITFDDLKISQIHKVSVPTFADSATVGIEYNRFTDVAGHPAEDYIKALSLLGIARGRTNTNFAPDESITRAEFTEMVAYASGLTASDYAGIYTDVNKETAYADMLQAAYTAGLIDANFVSGNTFNGNALITRAEIASMLSQGYTLKGETVPSDIIANLTTNTPNGTMTRADATKLVFDLQDRNTKMLQCTFNSGLDSWKLYLRTAAVASGKENATGSKSWNSADGHTDSGCLLFDLTNTGKDQVNCFWWERQLSDSNGLLEKGQTYLLTFFAKVEGNSTPVNLNAVKFINYDTKDAYTNVCSDSLSGDGWQLYTMELTATATVTSAQLIFQAGGCENTNTKVYIDDISLQKIDKGLIVQATAQSAYQNEPIITGNGKYYNGQNADMIATGTKVGGECYLANTWIDQEYGNVVGLGSVYNNPVTKSRTMTVFYQKYAVQEKDWGFTSSGNTADVELTDVSRDAGNVTVSAKLSIPEGYTLVDVGVLYHNGSYIENFSVFTEDAVMVRPEAVSADGTFQVFKSGYETTSAVLVKGYAICKNADGNYIVFYGKDKVAAAEENQAQIDYELIYNLEMLYMFVHSDPNEVGAWENIVQQIATTDSDMITLTPQACRTLLWPTQVEDSQWHAVTGTNNANMVYKEMKDYCEAGNDPFQVILDMFRENGFDTVFADFRMNEKQGTDNESHPFHSPYYLDHKEYWLNPDSLTNNRVFNYMESEVREYYFNLLKELVTNYDVDGLSLDFERAPIFFKDEEIAEGTQVMTDFVGRIRAMLDEVGAAKGKYLPLGVRVPSSVEKSLSVGLDVAEWAERGYIDYVNATSSYFHTPSVDVESYIDDVRDDGVKVYGELQFTVYESATDVRVCSTAESIKSIAESFYARGVDGLSAFNMDYSSNVTQTLLGLTGVTDREALKEEEKHYVFKTGYDYYAVSGGDVSIRQILPVESSEFNYALLRIRTDTSCENVNFTVTINGSKLSLANTISLTDPTELFPRLSSSSSAYPEDSCVKYYVVPLNLIENGENEIVIQQPFFGSNCKIELVELGIYHENSYALQGTERTP